MSDNGQFFSKFATDAQIASAATGVLRSVILAQWADETSYGTSQAFTSGWNFAGVSYGGSVNGFPSQQAGLDAYIQVLNQSTYDSVRQEKGFRDQCITLGKSGWAASGYDVTDFNAGVPFTKLNWGIDLINIVNQNNLTKYDPSGSTDASGSPFSTHAGTSPVSSLGTPIPEPPPGLASTIAKDSFIINGTSMDLDVSGSLTNAGVSYNITSASVLMLTLQDPTRSLINHPVLNQKSVLNLTTSLWVIVALEKQGNVLTVTFEPWVVQALRTATGAFTVSTGQMTRTAFAGLLVSQVQGAVFTSPPQSYLYGLDEGYARPTQEQVSRGTIKNPLEDSWTCLQRLASEIDFRCFEYNGSVYFGPDSWLTTLPAAVTVVERTGGIQTVDGTYDTGQPLGDVKFTAVAGTWTPAPGQRATVSNLGPFSQAPWIVATMERDSLFQPDIAVTLQQPQPSLPEPTTGGTRPAVGETNKSPGDQQTTAGTAAAQAAIAYAKGQLGKPYIWGGENPNSGFDCSGLTQASYAAAGISIPRVAATQQAAGPAVPAGASNLKPGDLVFFGPQGGPASHVGLLTSVTPKGNKATMINAPYTGVDVRYDSFNPTVGAAFGADVYLGATRPAP